MHHRRRIAGSWLAWASLITVGRTWPHLDHLTLSALYLDDVRGGDGCWMFLFAKITPPKNYSVCLLKSYDSHQAQTIMTAQRMRRFAPTRKDYWSNQMKCSVELSLSKVKTYGETGVSIG